MAKFHSSKNDRSWISDHVKTKETLRRHHDLMTKYMAEGLTKDKASKKAYDEITKGAA